MNCWLFKSSHAVCNVLLGPTARPGIHMMIMVGVFNYFTLFSLIVVVTFCCSEGLDSECMHDLKSRDNGQ